MRKLIGIVLISFSLVACHKDEAGSGVINIKDDFTTGLNGWQTGFSDYPIGEEVFYELKAGHAFLPQPLNTSDGALLLSGNNHSDDLLMFAKKKVSGLAANTRYKVTFRLNMASNAAEGSFGVGGSPAESVYVGIGAAEHEPVNIKTEGYYRINIDIGNQSEGGTYRKVIGNFSNGTEKPQYALIERRGAVEVSTDASGEIWLMVSLDSAFEATTTAYFTSIEVKLEKISI